MAAKKTGLSTHSTPPKKTVPRILGVNFPFNDKADFVYMALMITKDQEGRSASNVAFRILEEYFENTSTEFKRYVADAIDKEAIRPKRSA